MRNHTNHTGAAGAPPGGPRTPELFGTATVGERGQLVIPRSARERYGIRPGDRLVVLGGATGAEGLLLVRAELVGQLLAATVRKLTTFRESVRKATEPG